MKTMLHLLAMPLAYPLHPSSQLGYLHAYAEQELGELVAVRSHHAFLDILHDMEGLGMAAFFETYSLMGEEVLFLTCCYQAAYRDQTEDFLPAREFEDALARYNSYGASPENCSQQDLVPIARDRIVALNDAMERYLADQLIPSLREDCLNVIGMTASFCQVFGSIFAARYIRQHTDKPVLFVFGGSSYSLPEGSRTLANWRVEGLLVAGSGEAPLAQIVRACARLADAEGVVEQIAAQELVNVTRIGATARPIELAMSRDFMSEIPAPNYDDYFTSLRALCRDDAAFDYAVSHLVSIPLEGSRGCFAKCDFCHNPNITSEFRTLTGLQVAERALSMVAKYGTRDVTFVDSVSNTWAEGYADHILAQGAKIRAFMEMRVHAPESFWVKLALSGATTIQLGVESIAEPLLRSMRKGTTVMQNLSATKYMAEMGTSNASNLIIHHPKSTVYDVEETRRVMVLLEHFPIFMLSHFVVSYASPLYNELPERQKAELHRGFDWLPDALEEFSWPRHLSYTYPPAWIDPAVVDAWKSFQAWYADHVKDVSARAILPAFTVQRDGTCLHFVDTRFGVEDRYTLTGDAARVYAACHRVATISRLAQDTELDESTVQSIVSEQVARRSMLQIDDRFLSIALRPSSELIENLSRSPRSVAARRHRLATLTSARVPT